MGGIPAVRLSEDQIRRIYNSAPGELPGQVYIDIAASSPTEIISEVAPSMDVTALIMDVVAPTAGSICGIIALSILLAPIAPYIPANNNIV